MSAFNSFLSLFLALITEATSLAVVGVKSLAVVVTLPVDAFVLVTALVLTFKKNKLSEKEHIPVLHFSSLALPGNSDGLAVDKFCRIIQLI